MPLINLLHSMLILFFYGVKSILYNALTAIYVVSTIFNVFAVNTNNGNSITSAKSMNMGNRIHMPCHYIAGSKSNNRNTLAAFPRIKNTGGNKCVSGNTNHPCFPLLFTGNRALIPNASLTLFKGIIKT